jgi:hypothetical protein
MMLFLSLVILDYPTELRELVNTCPSTVAKVMSEEIDSHGPWASVNRFFVAGLPNFSVVNK